MAGLGLCVVGLVSCSAKQPETRKTSVVDLTHGIVAKMPVLESGATFGTSRWLAVPHSQRTASAYALARRHAFFASLEATESEGFDFDLGLDELIGDGSESESSSSSGSEAPASGEPSTEPSVGSGELATGPEVGSGDFASGPGVGSGSFSASPGLFASFGSGGVASADDFAAAYCNLFSGIVDYALRCIDGIGEEEQTLIEEQFGEETCRASLAPALSESFTGAIPSALVDLLNCVGDNFSTAACGTGTDLSPGVTEALASCGLTQ